MTIHDLVLFAFIMPTIFIVQRLANRLDILPPLKRVGFGVAGFSLACILWAATMSARPILSSHPHIRELSGMTLQALITGLLILSVIQIYGGAVQRFRRWRHYRRIAAKRS